MSGARMPDDFADRLRSGLQDAPARGLARERRVRRTVAGVAVGVGALAIVAAVGLGASGLLGGGAAAPSVQADPTPSPPPGFEGVAAGEPTVVETTGPQQGDAGGGDPESFSGYHDVYVTCMGVGVVTVFGEPIDCGAFAVGTVVASIGTPVLIGEPSAQIQRSADFTGEVHEVRRGEAIAGAGGGTVTVTAPCTDGLVIGGIDFTCPPDDGVSFPSEIAAWGVAVPEGALAPSVEGASLEQLGLITFEPEASG